MREKSSSSSSDLCSPETTRMLAELAERPALKAYRDVACCGDGAWLMSHAMVVPPTRTRAAMTGKPQFEKKAGEDFAPV